eukprot:scaffold94002_cov63-Phaeocystis_antarctica.AAC.1
MTGRLPLRTAPQLRARRPHHVAPAGHRRLRATAAADALASALAGAAPRARPLHTVAASTTYGVGPRGRPVPRAAAGAGAALPPAPHARGAAPTILRAVSSHLAAVLHGHSLLHRPTHGARDLHRPRAAGAARQARRAAVAAPARAAAGDALTESPRESAAATRGLPAAGRVGGAAGAQRGPIPVRGQATALLLLRAGAAAAACVGRHPMLRSQLPG